MRTGILAAALLLLGAASSVVAGCGDRDQAPPPEVVPRTDEPPRKNPGAKIILVVVDALRADRLGCYGHGAPTSPTIDRLAREGVLFESARAASPWTAPSFGSLLTGVSPSAHGAGGVAEGDPLGPVAGHEIAGLRSDVATLPELLPGGTETGAIVNNTFVTEELGFHRGFREFDGKDASMTRYRRADETTRLAVEWLKTHGDRPFFLLLHYFDPHMGYGPPERFISRLAEMARGRIAVPFTAVDAVREGKLSPTSKEQLFIRGLYDGEVAFVDEQLGQLREAMVALGRLDDTWIFLTSDHGEEHFEHGGFEHGHAYEEEVVRVPLIARYPGGARHAGRRVRASVRHVDVPATIAEIFGVRFPERIEGESLLPMIEGAETEHRAALIEYNLFGEQRAALFDGRRKLIWNRGTRSGFYYDLEGDPKEQRKVRAPGPVLDGLVERLGALRIERRRVAKDKRGGSARLPSSSREALRSLGYLK